MGAVQRTQMLFGIISLVVTVRQAHAHAAPQRIITVDLYGEALCPDCDRTVVDTIGAIYHTGMRKYVNVTYYAYGKVKVNGTCQHGPLECLYNRHINIIQKRFKFNWLKWYPTVSCIEAAAKVIGYKNPDPVALAGNVSACEQTGGLDPQDIAAAAQGPEGDAMEAWAGNATAPWDLLSKYVPWMVIDGVAVGPAFEDLERFICIALPPQHRSKSCAKDPRWPPPDCPPAPSPTPVSPTPIV